MEVELVGISTLKPYEKNPRINEMAIDKVAKSIEKFGFNQPIVTDEDLRICVGHTRWAAAKRLGLKKVPIYKRKMSEKEFLAYNLADNRTGEDSKWDDELLAEVLGELNDIDSDFLEDTGFEEKELDNILERLSLDDEIEDQPDVVQGNDPNDKKEKNKNLKIVQLFFTEEGMKPFMEACNKLKEYYQVETITDAIEIVVNERHDELL